MKIIKLEPQGYCSGVKNALHIAYQALENHTLPQPIYLLGSIIHNKIVIENLKKKGAILLEEKGVSKKELLKKIDKGTIIISAHGVSKDIYTLAEQKGLTIIDTTCGNVRLVHQRIEKHLKEGYTCLYIGTKGHPECEGILGISSSIILIESLEEAKALKINTEKIYATNQTTLSLYDTKQIYDSLASTYPKAILDNSICRATTIRQQACYEQEKVDLCLVVGDRSSSNTKKLALASQSVGIHTILVENLSDVQRINLKDIKSVSITSGASTPKDVVEKIICYLEQEA